MKDTGAFVYVVDDDVSAGDSSLTILRHEPGAFEGRTGKSRRQRIHIMSQEALWI